MPTATTSRKRVPAAQRRTLLLDAADQVFADRGYRAAGVDVIARHAGVTVPVLYDHFRSKTDLYAELVARHYQALREVWFRHAATQLSRGSVWSVFPRLGLPEISTTVAMAVTAAVVVV